jgi:hypothetical protein
MSETVSPSEDPLQRAGDGGNSPETGDFESGADPRDNGADGDQAADRPAEHDDDSMDVPPTSNDDMQDGPSDPE